MALSLLSRVEREEKIRLAGVQVHGLERGASAQLGLFGPERAAADKHARLNQALDKVTNAPPRELPYFARHWRALPRADRNSK